MRFWWLCGACILFLPYNSAWSEGSVTAQLPVFPDGGVLIGDSEHCGARLAVTDGLYDTGFAWQYGGIEGAEGGAFAECLTFPSPTTLCSVSLDISQVDEGLPGGNVDVFLWADVGGAPGNVIAMTVYGLGIVGSWPEASRHFIPIEACVVGQTWFGCRGDWPGQAAKWFLCADLNSGEGCAITHVAPGLEFPSGWTSVENIWGPTAALGLGVEWTPAACDPNPIIEDTWGRIKSLYR